MPETTEQYITRITGYVAGKDHFKEFQAAPKKLRALAKKAKGKKMTDRPSPDKWSIAEIITHLAESELVISFRLRMMLASNGVLIQVVDQNAWQANAGHLMREPKKALDLFEMLRMYNVSLLKSITKEQWEMFGMHQERGKETVARVVEMYAGHDINHMLQIEGILNGTRK
ncbi:MAG: DinB family protein [Ignavibacteriae bacterium]|nr:DinB family protein [Ignavibacteriota bacterium]